MKTEGSKIQRMNTQYYSRMFSQLKKSIQSPESRTNNSTIRMGSADKKSKLEKNHVTLNINKLNKLQISNSTLKKSNLSSYFTTPAQKSVKVKKTLKSQPNASIMKIKFNPHKPEDLRYYTQANKKEFQVILEYQSFVISTFFPETLKIQSVKKHLFQQMLAYNRANLSQLLNLVAFQSTQDEIHSFVDYWLTQPTQTLQIFTKNGINCLKLRPLFHAVVTREIGLRDFTIYQCVGVGGFSKVYLAKCKVNGKLCALKFISKSYIVNNKKFKLLQNQRQILANTQNPSIITLYHAFQTKNYIVFSLEYCPNNQLYQYLKEKQRLDQNQGKQIFQQILLGISYLHSKKILYRDIKLQNLLIDADGHIKITDFGLSKPNCDENQVTYSYCGSPEYMAPEMLLKCGHSYEVDYYALGILLYQLLIGISPFSAKTKAEIYYSTINHQVKFPKEVPLSKQVKSLLIGLLHKNPNHRIGSLNGINQISHHPWMKKKVNVQNSFKGKIFKEYRQVRQSDTTWLQNQFQWEKKNYQKQFKQIYYENIKIYKQRINDYLKLEQQAKKSLSKSPTATTSPLLSRNQSRIGTPKGCNPFLKKLR